MAGTLLAGLVTLRDEGFKAASGFRALLLLSILRGFALKLLHERAG